MSSMSAALRASGAGSCRALRPSMRARPAAVAGARGTACRPCCSRRGGAGLLAVVTVTVTWARWAAAGGRLCPGSGVIRMLVPPSLMVASYPAAVRAAV